MSKVKIIMDEQRKGRVYIDDKEIKGVRNLTFEASPQQIPIISLDLIPSQLEIELESAKLFKEKDFSEYSFEELTKIAFQRLSEEAIKKAFKK